MLFPLTRTFRVLAQSLGTSTRSTAKNGGENRLPLFEALEGRTLMSTYYVGASGSDGNSGTSTGAAWHTISKVNSANLKAGVTTKGRKVTLSWDQNHEPDLLGYAIYRAPMSGGACPATAPSDATSAATDTTPTYTDAVLASVFCDLELQDRV